MDIFVEQNVTVKKKEERKDKRMVEMEEYDNYQDPRQLQLDFGHELNEEDSDWLAVFQEEPLHLDSE